MSRRRTDITNKQVIKMLEDKNRYPTLQAIADALGCTTTLVRSVAKGHRKEKPYNKKPEKSNKPLCQCCNTNPIGKGLRFLCPDCYRKKSHYNDIESCEFNLTNKLRGYKSGRSE
jgi:hypothetical protein